MWRQPASSRVLIKSRTLTATTHDTTFRLDASLPTRGAVDEAEYIDPVFQRRVENEHAFKPCDTEHAQRGKRRGREPRMPNHVRLGSEEGERLVHSSQEA